VNPPQILFSRDGVEIGRTTDARAALVELRRLGGPKADLTAGNGRINAYSRPYAYGVDNSANLVAYAMVAP
jgi:hypothetical protein